MLWYFKKAKYMYLGMVILGFSFLILIQSTVNGNHIFPFGIGEIDTFLFFLILVAWVLLWASICNIYANKRLSKIMSILTNECNPIECTNVLTRLINQNTFRKPFMTTLLLDLSLGLSECGKYIESLDILKKINSFSKNAIGNCQRVVYYNNLFYAYLKNNELENASNALKNMNRIISNSKFSETMKNDFENLYTQELFLLNIEQGIFDDSEHIFKNMFESGKHNLERVSAKLILGQIYLHDGDTVKAIDAFKYVVKNGNLLQIVDEAKVYLENIHK